MANTLLSQLEIQEVFDKLGLGTQDQRDRFLLHVAPTSEPATYISLFLGDTTIASEGG